MYRIIPPQEFITAPWKNGGGITHEIARDGPDRAAEWGWRLSIAEVASDGPFSRFDGMARILTVIAGAGLQLRHSGGVLAALPLAPLHFSGDVAIDCRRVAGDVRDFNVIYDPARFAAQVQVLGAGDYPESPGLTGILPLTGDVDAGGAPVQGFALGQGAVAIRGQALRVIIQRR